MAPTLSAAAQRHLRRNFSLGLVNGALFNLSSSLLDPSLVLTWLASQLTSSNFLIGLVMPINQGGWFLPQLLVSGYLQGRKRKLPLYVAMSAPRALCWALMALALFLIADRTVLLILFYTLLTVYSLGGGVAGLSFLDIIAKAIPSTRRGSFFGWRRFLGGILALGGSLVVQYVLDERRGLAFPHNFGVLFFLSFLIMSAAMISFGLFVEPVEPVLNKSVALLGQMKRALHLPRRDANYGRFLAARVLATAAGMATPFYIVYAKRALGVSASMVGVYLAWATLAGIASTLVWGQISDRRGNRRLILLASLVGLATPLAALSIPLLASWQPSLAAQASHAFAVVFVLLSIFGMGLMTGYHNYLLDIAPVADRPLYIGLANTLTGLTMLASAVGGLIADLAGLAALFWVAAAFYAGALLLAGKLREPRETIRA
ncbi:MAG TPA: MFS transporter [Anaerolineae bacterium]|nr:MFS transporter [Anaerolineae bacterium]